MLSPKISGLNAFRKDIFKLTVLKNKNEIFFDLGFKRDNKAKI